MQQQPGRSRDKVIQGQKQSVKGQLVNFTRSTKKGPFIPTEGWMKFVTSERWFEDITRALPKSPVPHGVRVNFRGDPATFQEAAKAIATTYPKAVSLQQSPLKDFFDLGFLTKEDADQAAEEVFTVEVTDHKGKITKTTLPTTRTRFNKDTTLFISFEALPLDMSREEVESQLKNGLAKYDVIVQFELLKNPYMSHLSTAKAMAMISPLDAITTASIPRRATILKADGTTSSEFKVFPEQTPPICALCSALGHREALCPSTIEGVWAAEEANQQEPAGSEATGTQANALKPLPWGSLAEYQMVAPITNCQKKAQAKAKQSQNQPMDAQDPIQMESHDAPANSQAITQAEVGPQPQSSLAVSTANAEPTIQAHAQSEALTNQVQSQTQATAQEEPTRLRRKAQPKIAAITKQHPMQWKIQKRLELPKREVPIVLLRLVGPQQEGPLGHSSYWNLNQNRDPKHCRILQPTVPGKEKEDPALPQR